MYRIVQRVCLQGRPILQMKFEEKVLLVLVMILSLFFHQIGFAPKKNKVKKVTCDKLI